MSNVLIYKQTHFDDPGETGVFGINDCMGRVRERDFDYAIALHRDSVSWIGIGARKVPWHGHSPQVILKHFLPVLPKQHYSTQVLASFMASRPRAAACVPFLMSSKSRLIIEI
jgi:hypothetical protein